MHLLGSLTIGNMAMRDIIDSIKINRVCKLLQLWPGVVKPARHSLRMNRVQVWEMQKECE